MKKLLILLGAIALTFTLATAEGKCGNSQKDMMNNDGKCGASQKGMMEKNEKRENKQKGMMNNDGKCNASMKPKPAPDKGKCGKGKCGE
jgi:hypothetical protein